MVAAAEREGARLIAVTDHLTLPHDMDPACEASVPEAELGDLIDEVSAAAAAHPAVEVVQGFECDWYEGCEDNVRRWSEGATFLLGSVHWVHGAWIDDPDDRHIWDELGADAVWEGYVDAWCAACASDLPFDSMAHPDLMRRFEREGAAYGKDPSPLWDRMAECARDTNRRIEVSTAGLRKSVRGYYPAPPLLERFAAAGVGMTVGSDAHRTQDVGWGIADAYAYAAAAGFDHVDVPRADGSWDEIALR
jgi:histidinol-phosphatase (PHP family)